ncbi:unnamed protein product [Mycena citricolor]|uniref:Myb/SANT-like domain-containing protein n=1 Tax=Mycena citricolor TaxID=2018698 RepID=A0AAD2K774_9AGAR|nr:unnamed protein product [Mycena citricolor]
MAKTKGKRKDATQQLSDDEDTPGPEPDSDRAKWLDADIAVLLDALIANKAAGGNGGNFKMRTFNLIAPDVDAVRKEGAKKTGNNCQTKYKNLRETMETRRGLLMSSGYATVIIDKQCQDPGAITLSDITSTQTDRFNKYHH